MDRTNWKFSSTNINILTLGIIYDGMAFPIVFKMMDKRGNSNTEERIELIQRFISLAGKDSIAHLMADREFVGREWLAFLNSKDYTIILEYAITFISLGMVRNSKHIGFLMIKQTSLMYLLCQRATLLSVWV